MIDIAALSPEPWSHERVYEPNSALRMDGDFLSEDLCMMEGKYFFVRCVLEIPVHGLAQKFGFGCWGTLSRSNFEAYVAHFDDGAFQGVGPWTSWLCNQLYDYIQDEPEGCWMAPQLNRQRPVLAIMNEDHPLARDQREGISPEKLIAIYKFYGHEVAA